MSRVDLREYRTSTVRLTEVQAAALRAAAVQVVPISDGLYDVTPQSTVGSLRVDGTAFTIHPKMGIRRLLYLVSYATDRVLDTDELAGLQDDEDLLAAMAWLFAHAADAATARGIRRGYRRRQESAPTVRGRIDLARQLRRRHGRLFPLEIDHDDFTVDTDANRILLAATLRLDGVGGIGRETHRRLARVVERLDGVQPTVWRSDPPATRTTRLDAHYDTALQLARLVLAGRSIEPVAGATDMSALLFNLNTVFEDFVVKALRERLRLTTRSFPQNCRGQRLQLATDGVNLEPDLSWWEAGRCVFVGDVKYKKVNPAGIKHPDLYQLLAYAIATGLDEALLIYAAGEQPVTHEVVHVGRKLHVVTLELDGSLELLRAELDDLAERVRRLRQQGPSMASAG